MKLIALLKGNFDVVAGVATESYLDVFDGELPGIHHLKLKPGSQMYCTNYEMPKCSQKLTWPQDTGM